MSTLPPADTVHSVWIVVVTKLKQEVRAKRELEQQGFEVYLPMKLFANKRGQLMALPFFPRYLFARVTPDVANWRTLYSTLGVAAVLCRTEGKPYGVRDWVVQQIRAREEGGFLKIGLQSDAPRFQQGERVRFEVEGRTIEAVFHEKVDEKRARVLVNWLGRDSRATVDLRKLEQAA